MSRVYGLMSFGMVVTGLVAYFIGADIKAAMNGEATTLLSPEMIQTMYGGAFRYVIMFAPLAVVFMFGAAINKLSENAARGVFVLFSALMGLSLASIFAIYTGVSIAQTFFVTAIAFLSLSLWGYTTKKDISAWGSFLIMGVVGLIIASIVNIFLASSALMFAISAIGVLVFLSGLPEHVPVPADVHGLPRVIYSNSEFERPGWKRLGLFLWQIACHPNCREIHGFPEGQFNLSFPHKSHRLIKRHCCDGGIT